MKQGSEKKFPVNANDYELCEEIGDGLSVIVYRARCIPLNEIVAVKVLDLEKCKNDLDRIRGEVQTLSLTNDPNLLKAHCSFMSDHNLWIVMPYMSGGSCLHIMKSAHPEGFEEPVIATLLREILKALVCLHGQGFIHRDVKAGNILIDSNGTVKLADFGVSACMFDTGNRQRSRTTFVGTPCWMAPEVMNQADGSGYDFKADIWSFGITALELAHGHAPFSKYPPMKVLMMTIHNAPPGLDYERDKKFSKSFKQLVSACLVKDPKKRPTSEKLLKHQFFKHARSADYLSRTILNGVPSLPDRYKALKAKEAELLVKNKALQSDKNEQSQQQYARGISAWNFDLEDLKNQAALIEEPDSNPESHSSSDASPPDEKQSSERLLNLDVVSHLEDGINLIQSLENSPSSFPTKPLEELKGCFHVCEDHLAVSSSSPKYPESQIQLTVQNFEEREVGRYEGQSTSPLPKSPLARPYSGSPQQDILSPKKVVGDGDRACANVRHQLERNYSSAVRKQENIPEGGVVQCKGRFKVTSADAPPSGSTNGFASAFGSSTSSNPTTPTFSNFVEREEFLKLIKYLVRRFGNSTDSADTGIDDLLHIPTGSTREKELQSQVNQLEQSAMNTAEELQRQKAKITQLEERVKALEKNIEKRDE